MYKVHKHSKVFKVYKEQQELQVDRVIVVYKEQLDMDSQFLEALVHILIYLDIQVVIQEILVMDISLVILVIYGLGMVVLGVIEETLLVLKAHKVRKAHKDYMDYKEFKELKVLHSVYSEM